MDGISRLPAGRNGLNDRLWTAHSIAGRKNPSCIRFKGVRVNDQGIPGYGEFTEFAS